MKKFLKSSLSFYLVIFVLFQSCSDKADQAQNDIEDIEADIILKSVDYNALNNLKGKRINNDEIISTAQLTFDVKGSEAKANVALLSSSDESIERSVLLDDNNQAYISVEVIENNQDDFITNYYDAQGVLILTTQGDGETMTITYLNEESPNARQMVTFMGCLKKLWDDDTFKVVALAGAIGGYGGYIAAGAVIGCGIASW